MAGVAVAGGGCDVELLMVCVGRLCVFCTVYSLQRDGGHYCAVTTHIIGRTLWVSSCGKVWFVALSCAKKCVNVTRVCATNATNVWCFLRVLVGRFHCWFTKLYDVTYIRINVG